MPLALHAVAEVESQPLPDAGAGEFLLSRATRKVRAWGMLQNGGYAGR